MPLDNDPLIREEEEGWCCFKRKIYKSIDDRYLFIHSAKKLCQPNTTSDNYISTTKYSALTFIPKNLFEQLQKAANLYFFIVAVIVSIPGISGIEPWTCIMPLSFVLLITMIKEGVEDYKRHKEDILVNNRKCLILNEDEGKFIECVWSDVKDGDIIKIYDKEEFPADLLVVYTSTDDGVCQIQTCNLDGELNLKIRNSINRTQQIFHHAINECNVFPEMNVIIQRSSPNHDLLHFDGLWIERDTNERYQIGKQQLLLRGAQLEDTEFIIGVAIAVGKKTKLAMNSFQVVHKTSKMEKMSNTQMYHVFIIQFFLTLLCAILSVLGYDNDTSNMWYLYWNERSLSSIILHEGVISFWCFFVLFSSMVPISLYVSMEMVKIGQAFFISKDLHMYDSKTDTPATARTSDVPEELGQVEYIFSDKTGTLTQNEMIFRLCSIRGISYGQFSGLLSSSSLLNNINHDDDNKERELRCVSLSSSSSSVNNSVTSTSSTNNNDDIPTSNSFYDLNLMNHFLLENSCNSMETEFLLCLVLCNSVSISDGDNDVKVYKGASVDEVALVNAAKEVGFSLKERTKDYIIISTPWENEMKYDILHCFDFTSERARQSIIIKTPDDRVVIYCKGADVQIKKRLQISSMNKEYNDLYEQKEQKVLIRCMEQLEEYSSNGLRTLLFSYRVLDADEYTKWNNNYINASKQIGMASEQKQRQLDDMIDQIENKLTLIGVSAIEDKLQENVCETITSLREAGIKIWMLTGDKSGTAVNIARSCGLIDHELEMIYLLDNDSDYLMRDNKHSNNDDDKHKDSDVYINNVTKRLENVFNEYFTNNQYYNNQSNKNYALVFDGVFLDKVLQPSCQGGSTYLESLLLSMLSHTNTRVVVCSRLAPLQKFSLVSLIKNRLDAVTLAIGDGANDVAMIQVANIGVGLHGHEGKQAVNNSDYAISKFKYLNRLILVHGRLSYKRNVKLIQYSFYKNMTLAFIQLFYAFISLFSGQEAFDGSFLSSYNLIFTALPILLVAVFHKEFEPNELEKMPYLHNRALKNTGFNMHLFWIWLLIAIFHSILLFIVGYMIIEIDYQSYWVASAQMYTLLLIVVSCKLIFVTSWNMILIVSLPFSLLLWYLYLYLYSSFYVIFPDGYGVFTALLSNPLSWLFYPLFIVIAFLPDLTWLGYKHMFNPLLKHQHRQYL